MTIVEEVIQETNFVEGYTRAIKDMDKVVTDSIRTHGGATTALGLLNVFNDIVQFLHESNVELTEEISTQN